MSFISEKAYGCIDERCEAAYLGGAQAVLDKCREVARYDGQGDGEQILFLSDVEALFKDKEKRA